MEFKWRKWNRVTHRDLGYFFVGMILIYSISGIAINHRELWNPSYIISNIDFNVAPVAKESVNKEYVEKLVKDLEMEGMKAFYFPNPKVVKIFINHGIISFNIESGSGWVEMTKKRVLFNQVNFLHYDPGRWWTWFSDIFAVSLCILAISGLFILKGKNGLKWRGAILSIIGLLIPLLFLIFFRK